MFRGFLTFLFFLPLLGYADSNEKLTKDLSQRLQKKIEQSEIKKEELGIYVSIGDKHETSKVFGLNEKVGFIPASLSKIVTAGAALSELRPGTQVETQLASAGRVENNVLKGDLYLIGHGDPGFVSESMWNLVNEFVRNQIHIIEGDIVVDDSWFDSIRFDPSREESDVDRAYNSPIGAMSFNWNSVNIYIRPNNKIGKPPLVFADPDNNYIRVINQAKTIGSGKGSRISVNRRESSDKKFHGDEIIVTGTISTSAEEKVVYKSITQPEIWSGYNLKAFLERRGIEVTGSVRAAAKVGDLKIFASVKSHSIEKMVKDMMKFSNNYVAEMLVKQIAATKVGTPGSIPIGMERLRAFIRESGIQEGLEIVNPSGLTRKNKFFPKSLHDFLISLRGRFDIFAENLSAYPLAGVDGTLEKRMRGTPAEGWVRAKTGMLSGVIGLAGFAGRKDGQVLTFTFIYNGRGEKVYAARQLFDELAVELVQ
ncbi:MAG: D-alanyl-D-alanine carboxypeptidase/D-alanyl-D-alanine-endopeptidase [Bdellovibrionales bacterium]|nr:D-alanyl-D-alanine carboxypeptidase/D-alanyl-D-alanine-endopeptidase [Bdellovibrionales bacterium]